MRRCGHLPVQPQPVLEGIAAEGEALEVDGGAVRVVREAFNAQDGRTRAGVERSGRGVVRQRGVDGERGMAERHTSVLFQHQKHIARHQIRPGNDATERFRQPRHFQRDRRAIEQPHVTMLGHLTGRLLLEREGYAVDVEKVIDAAIANGVAIELNANPWRLDMDWRHWKKAAEKGLLTSINPDAHRTAQLEFYKLGVGIARKGWLTKEHVLNTKSLPEMKRDLAKGRRA